MVICHRYFMVMIISYVRWKISISSYCILGNVYLANTLADPCCFINFGNFDEYNKKSA